MLACANAGALHIQSNHALRCLLMFFCIFASTYSSRFGHGSERPICYLACTARIVWCHCGIVFWRFLGQRFERKNRQLGSLLGLSWHPVGSSWRHLESGAKIVQEVIQKSIDILMPLGIDFWKDFDGFWMPKSSNVESKIKSKIDVNFEGR